jgi:hypothetical protein
MAKANLFGKMALPMRDGMSMAKNKDLVSLLTALEKFTRDIG